MTTVLFDDKYEVICENTDIHKVKPMTEREYYERGCTAFLDAIGKTISNVFARHRLVAYGQMPAKTIVVIITDGCENESREYSLD